ncbi:MAG TPA: PIG-L family deacetylase [Terriglobales bacterium]|nr:PIG-L family deacetylase [Terriglobales bacterium]
MPKRTVLKLSFFVALLLAACFAQTPGAPPASPPSSPSVESFLDPLPQDTGSAGLKQELRRLQNTGRLMMVVAHPDDEDGGLLTLESRGKGVQTLLLTLTRGEGGQNKTGDTFSDELGVLRTLELLAADRYYGVEQRFTHVADFGYSKTPEETFQKWGGHDVPLSDIVRVIRQFRPDVLIARFSGTDRDGHGHHQASAILTKEAFRAAADPNRFPEQIEEGLRPWRPKKLYIGNVCGFGASTCADENYTVKLNTGEEDPVLGMSYFQFAIEGLRHQESQGLGDLRIPNGPRFAFYKLADSVLPKTTDADGHEKDLFDGIDTSLPGLASKFGEENSVPGLKPELEKISGEVRDSVADLSNAARDFESLHNEIDQSGLSTEVKLPLLQSVDEKTKQSTSALNLALNANLEVTVAPPAGPGTPVPPESEALTAVSPGQKFEVIAKLHNGSKYWLMIQNATLDHPDWVRQRHADETGIAPGEDYYANFLVQVPENAPISRPYWHRDDPQTEAVNKIDDAKYITLPFPPNPLNATITFDIASKRGEHSVAPDFLRRKEKAPSQGTISGDVQVPYTDEHGTVRPRELAIVPAFSVALEPAQQVIPVSSSNAKSVKAEVTSNLAAAPTGVLHLQAPDAWPAEPASADVSLLRRGETRDFQFKVTPQNLTQSRAESRATLDAAQNKYSEGYVLVSRDDLGSFYYFEPAIQHISVVDVKIPHDLKIGYIMGAGDDIPTILQQIGMDVTLIPADKVATENLLQFGTIVLGVRAYDTQKELVANNQKLLDFVSNGGTLMVQNNNSVGDFNSEHLTPYPTELSRARVSVEDAPVQVLAPDNQVFHYPNEISQKDFDGWVQERGLYFMSSWDDHFKPLLSCHDPGEPDQKGGMLLARYGKGTYIYTGYSFFRQLPAGVPGAIRLYVNLVSAGQSAASH